jgi:uncharacterized membrane protein (DUF4010 family)
MMVVAALLQPALAVRMGGMLAWLAACSFAATAWLWRGARPVAGEAAPDGEGRVFDLPTALGFGALLGAVAVIVRAAQQALGDAGVLAVAFVAGLGDVDPPLISSLQLRAQGQVDEAVAVAAIVLAVAANMIVKAAIAWTVGGSRVGRRVAGGYLAVLVAGAAAIAIVRA